MPFYEYQCSACQHHVEVLQKISDTPLRKCPDCGKSALKRLISAPVFRLKGGGWYETDFKSDGEKKRNLHGADDAGDTKSDAQSDAKNESKTETKASSKPVETKSASKPSETRKSAAKSAPKPATAKAGAKKKR